MPSYFQKIETASLEWIEKTPKSSTFGDVYFSLDGGIEETKFVFLEKNKLKQRWLEKLNNTKADLQKNFTIIETGFGTGLNFLCTAKLWQETTDERRSFWLEFISTEKYPLSKNDLKKCLENFPELEQLSDLLIKQYPSLIPGYHSIVFPKLRIKLLLLLGDIKNTLPGLEAKADAWFLDGFSPSRNPEMWSDELFCQIQRLSLEGSTFSTFTAASQVKKGMARAGFEVVKADGFGKKRDMLYGHKKVTLPLKPPDEEKPSPPVNHTKKLKANQSPWFSAPAFSISKEKSATVIGGGLAGTTTASRLAQDGWHVNLIERHEKLAEEASGNPAGVLYTKINNALNPQTEFYSSSYLHALRFLQHIQKEAPWSREKIWDNCGVIQLLKKQQGFSINESHKKLWNEEIVRQISPEEGEKLSGFKLIANNNENIFEDLLFYPEAGWVCPPRLCNFLTRAEKNIQVVSGKEAHFLEYNENKSSWAIKDRNEQTICNSEIVVIANSLSGNQFQQTRYLPLHKVRGQITSIPASEESSKLNAVICHDGYALPAIENMHCIGATFQPRDKQAEVRIEDNFSNLEKLNLALPDFFLSLPHDKTETTIKGRAAFRCQSPDYLPIVGPVTNENYFMEKNAELKHGRAYKELPKSQHHPGLFVNLAHGSRGLTSTPLAAEIITAYAGKTSQPVPRQILDALNPARFLIRKSKRKMK